MLGDIFEILIELRNKFLSSRIFILVCLYFFLIFILVSRLFSMQILKGEYYQKNYIQKSQKTITKIATRGNIYDVKGNLLAYNKLSYAVNIQDNGTYKKIEDKNTMIYRLVKILQKHNEPVIGQFKVALDENGNYVFTTSNESAKKRFLRDFYGLKSIDELDDDKGKYSSYITAKELVEKKFEYYDLYKIYGDNKEPIVLNDKEKLDIINIRYTMGFSAFHKYDATKVAENIKEETKIDIMENLDKLIGVSVDVETLRVYNDSIYFASIIGYIGKVQDNQLDELRKKNSEYTLNDTVGRSGIEEYMEDKLQGKKGYKVITVDNVGHILEVKDEKKSKAGDDIYLSLDRDLQIGVYNILEQRLAGILADKLVNIDEPNTDKTNSTDMLIPIKDAYFQLINNNVLSIDKFNDDDASANEKQTYQTFKNYQNKVFELIYQPIFALIYYKHQFANLYLNLNKYHHQPWIFSHL